MNNYKRIVCSGLFRVLAHGIVKGRAAAGLISSKSALFRGSLDETTS